VDNCDGRQGGSSVNYELYSISHLDINRIGLPGGDHDLATVMPQT
jgi:hypothetical protein